MSTKVQDPKLHGAVVTPNDTVNGETTIWPVDGISVNVAGDVVMVMDDGTELTVTLAAGIMHPLRPAHIKTTGTSATGIHKWWNA